MPCDSSLNFNMRIVINGMSCCRRITKRSLFQSHSTRVLRGSRCALLHLSMAIGMKPLFYSPFSSSVIFKVAHCAREMCYNIYWRAGGFTDMRSILLWGILFSILHSHYRTALLCCSHGHAIIFRPSFLRPSVRAPLMNQVAKKRKRKLSRNRILF